MFSQVWQYISFMTTALDCINSPKPYTQAGFEPGTFCSVGGREDHAARAREYFCS
jgi:hypothetical protein